MTSPKLSPGSRRALSLSPTLLSSQTARSPFASGSGSKATEPRERTGDRLEGGGRNGDAGFFGDYLATRFGPGPPTYPKSSKMLVLQERIELSTSPLPSVRSGMSKGRGVVHPTLRTLDLYSERSNLRGAEGCAGAHPP